MDVDTDDSSWQVLLVKFLVYIFQLMNSCFFVCLKFASTQMKTASLRVDKIIKVEVVERNSDITKCNQCSLSGLCV